MTNVFSWQNSISLCPASFCTPRPNSTVIQGVSSLPTFALQTPLIKKGHPSGVLVLEGIVSSDQSLNRVGLFATP